MPAPHPDLIAWIDTETTGLDPRHDMLLEIAVIITDNDLNEVGRPAHVLVRPERGIEAAVELMNDYVLNMHTENGLIAALRAGAGMPLSGADQHIARAIDAAADGQPLLLGGNSITHDRGFLSAHAPETFKRLHYRSIDVTSIEQDMIRDGYAEQIAARRETFTPTDGHRALGDIRDSIAQLRFLRDLRRQGGAR